MTKMCQACIIRLGDFFVAVQFEQFLSKMRLTGIFTIDVYRIIQLYYIF